MSIPLLWLLVSAGLHGAAPASDSGPAYTQVYSIFIQGALAGSEKVTETTDKEGNLLASSEHEMMISEGGESRRMAFTTTLRLAKGTYAPMHYSYKYTSGEAHDSYDVDVKDGVVTRVLNRGGQTSEKKEPLKEGLVIVDFSVYHQYDYLLRRYDFKKRGRQMFSDFLPLIGSQIPLALTYLGDSKLNHAGGSLPVRDFRFELVGVVAGTFSADANGRLIRLEIPAQNLEVLRQDLAPQPSPKK